MSLGRDSHLATVLGGLLLAVALQAMTATTVLADNGPHIQAGDSASSAIVTADGCAGCHRAHSASGQSLIVTDKDSDLCYACHGSTAQGATTNVTDGVIAASPDGLLGGGFTSARMDTSWRGASPARAVTSTHVHGEGTLWGAGAIGSGPGLAGFNLKCVSCHNPHGNGAYRILRPIPTDAPSDTEVVIADPAVKVYTVTSALNRYFGQIYMDGDYGEQVALDRWCASCHNRYDAPGPNSATTSSGDPIFTFRHGTRQVAAGSGTCGSCHSTPSGSGPARDPFEVTSAIAHVPVCEHCHVAHGTAARMGEISGSVPYPDGSTPAAGTVHSTLLRLDNRGVCRGCHST